jgi:hypothetical protein
MCKSRRHQDVMHDVTRQGLKWLQGLNASCGNFFQAISQCTALHMHTAVRFVSLAKSVG